MRLGAGQGVTTMALKLEPKDWITISISLLALVLSGMLAYLNVFRETDALNV
jgi:hypothetical protein